MSDAVSQVLTRLSVTISDLLGQLPRFHISPLKASVAGFGLYLLYVRSQRWKRYNAIHKKYEAKWNNGNGTITPAEAQVIIKVSMHYDLAWLMNYSLAFALFKTYAVPSISKLLQSTRQLGSEESVSRRYADTTILISNFFTCPITGFWDPDVGTRNLELGDKAQPAEDPRSMLAVARMNWLHSRYNIPNRDYLYTLSLFILEPARWANRFGWRPLSALEEYSYYLFWSEIGGRMGIQDIPDSIDGVKNFAQDYEAKYMKPAQSNYDTAMPTFNELLGPVPHAFGLKKMAEGVAICLVDDHVREAMMLPKQSQAYHTFTRRALKFVYFLQHYFLLPRADKDPRTTVNYDPNSINYTKSGPRMTLLRSPMQPWYLPEATGLGYYKLKLFVKLGIYSAMPGPRLKSQGFRLEEVGPTTLENRGHEDVFRQARKLQGCPITGPWSLEARQQEKKA